MFISPEGRRNFEHLVYCAERVKKTLCRLIITSNRPNNRGNLSHLLEGQARDQCYLYYIIHIRILYIMKPVIEKHR